MFSDTQHFHVCNVCQNPSGPLVEGYFVKRYIYEFNYYFRNIYLNRGTGLQFKKNYVLKDRK